MVPLVLSIIYSEPIYPIMPVYMCTTATKSCKCNWKTRERNMWILSFISIMGDHAAWWYVVTVIQQLWLELFKTIKFEACNIYYQACINLCLLWVNTGILWSIQYESHTKAKMKDIKCM